MTRIKPSSAVRFHRYDAAKGDLLVVFTSGRRYVYGNVPADVAIAFDNAESKGTFFNAEIKDRYPYREITR